MMTFSVTRDTWPVARPIFLLSLVTSFILLVTGCSKPRLAVFSDPGAGVTSVTGGCPIVRVGDFPSVGAWVYVEDQSQNLITDFSAGNFNVSENGVPQVVTHVKKVDNALQPLSVSILVDTTSSMSGLDANGNARLTVAQNAALGLVAALGALDQAEVVTFDTAATVRQALTSDKTLLNAAINAAAASTSTDAGVLYQAVGEACERLKSRSGRRIVILLTDSADSGSATAYATGQQVADALNREGIPVFTFGFTTGTAGSADTAALDYLASNTGGTYLSDASGDLPAGVLRVQTRVNNLVEVGFRSRVATASRAMKIFLQYGLFTVTFSRTYSY